MINLIWWSESWNSAVSLPFNNNLSLWQKKVPAINRVKRKNMIRELSEGEGDCYTHRYRSTQNRFRLFWDARKQDGRIVNEDKNSKHLDGIYPPLLGCGKELVRYEEPPKVGNDEKKKKKNVQALLGISDKTRPYPF